MDARQRGGSAPVVTPTGVTFRERMPSAGHMGPVMTLSERGRVMHPKTLALKYDRGVGPMIRHGEMFYHKASPLPGAPEVRYCPVVRVPRMSGIFCEQCNNRLVDLKRQALKFLVPSPKNKALLFGVSNNFDPKNSTNKNTRKKESSELANAIAENIHIPESFRRSLINDRCNVCDTHVNQLKHEAVTMVQSLERAQSDTATSTNNAATMVGPRNLSSAPRSGPNMSPQHRLVRQGKTVYATGTQGQGQPYLDQNVLSWVDPRKYNQMLSSPPPPQHQQHQQDMNGRDGSNMHSPLRMTLPPGHQNPVLHFQHQIQSGQYHNGRPHSPLPMQPYPAQGGGQAPVQFGHGYPHNSGYFSPHQHSPVHSPHSPHSPMSHPSAAASFFARAAQKLASKKKKRHQPPEPEPPPFPTKFYEILRLAPPPVPPGLLRGLRAQPPVGKVKVMLRICQDPNRATDQGPSFIGVDPRKKQVTLHDPSIYNGYTAPSQRKAGTSAPKMFAFDAVFSEDDSLPEICSSSLTEIVQSVVSGLDGCLFCYGTAKLDKTYTMIGEDSSFQTLGIIPCAISWLFRLIQEQKEKTGARFSVRVSAVEVAGRSEELKDLLADVASGMEAGSGTAPGVYLREDPISGTQLENQSELRAPTADKAAYYLDAALAARATPELEEDKRTSHLLFTLHVYQYRVEKDSQGSAGAVSGGRSRLHLVDLGSSGKAKDGSTPALTLHALGNVILALLNGQRHIPHRDSKVSQLLRESLGNTGCHTSMIAQVSPLFHHYNETLQVVQLAARIHRMRRRRLGKTPGQFSSASSEDSSSCDESHRYRRPIRPRMGVLREGIAYTNALSSHSDPEYTSSSEQSCDTVIYIGRNGQSLSDRELTDNEGPPGCVPLGQRAFMRRGSSRGSRSSEDEGNMSDRSNKSERSRIKMGTSAACLSSRSDRSPSHSTSSSPSKSSTGIPQPTTPTGQAVVQLPRKINVKAKPTLPGKMKSEDGKSKSGRSRGPMRMEIDPNNPPQEQWIDGPSAPFYPEASRPMPDSRAKPSNELWVDGPREFKSKNKKGAPNPEGNERWIDGPPAMLNAKRGHSHRMHTHMVPDEESSTKQREHTPPRGSVPHNTPHNSPHHVPHHHGHHKPKEVSLVDQYHQKIEKKREAEEFEKEGSEPPNVRGADGDSTLPRYTDKEEVVSEACAEEEDDDDMEIVEMKVEATQTTPLGSDLGAGENYLNEMNNNVDQKTEDGEEDENEELFIEESEEPEEEHSISNATLDSNKANVTESIAVRSRVSETPETDPEKLKALEDPETYMHVKPFVRDWVEKHSIMSSAESNVHAKIDERYDSKLGYENMIKHSRKSSRESSPMHHGKSGDRERSTSPKNTPGMSSKFKHELKKKLKKAAAMPPQASPNHRVAEWVQSIAADAKAEDKTHHHSLPRARHHHDDWTSADYHTNRRQEVSPRRKSKTQKQVLEDDGDDNMWQKPIEVGLRTDARRPNSLERPKPIVPDNQSSDNLRATISDLLRGNRQSAYEIQADLDLESEIKGSCDNLDLDITGQIQRPVETSTPIKPSTDRMNLSLISQQSNSVCEPLSPVLSDSSDVVVRTIVPPSSLRRPDGASNPHLNKVPYSEGEMSPSDKEFDKQILSPSKIMSYLPSTSTTHIVAKVTSPKRSVIGQSSEDFASESNESKLPTLGGCKSKTKPPLPTRTSSKLSSPKHQEEEKAKKMPKSGLPIFGIKSGRSMSASPAPGPSTKEKSSKLPQRSQSAESPGSSHSSNSPTKVAKSSKLPLSSKSPSGKSEKNSKEKSKDSKESKSKDVKAKDSKSKTKDAKEKTKDTKEKGKEKDSKAKESKSSKVSVRGSPLFRRDKTKDKEKEREKKEAKEKERERKELKEKEKKEAKELKNKGKDSKDRKDPKGKDSKLPVCTTMAVTKISKVSNERISELTGHTKLKLADSDGNDSGILMAQDTKLLSPYSAVTKPRNSLHSSSGHGSDISSTISVSGPLFTKHLARIDIRQGGTSSGYESMLRDSEATGSSSHNDSTSEGSSGGKVQGTKILRKKASSTRRSRSAPARTPDSPSPGCLQSPLGCRKAFSPPPDQTWIESEYAFDEPLELKHYDMADVERMQRRRNEEIEQEQIREVRHHKISLLLAKQEELKIELARAKERLMIDRDSWSYDLHVAEQMDWDDPNYLEALERETKILEKRVDACKSHIMIVTCFDITV
ncbi:kinesin-like protein KIF26A [Lineus longissimus]|uniref:kinesin-like protein KIF26A n=1 Tax=Lineus longissimus TaxID=88925 RepID=UPI00315D04C4